jgi:hypothetical protein
MVWFSYQRKDVPPQALPAVNVDGFPGDIGGIRGSQKKRKIGHLLHGA